MPILSPHTASGWICATVPQETFHEWGFKHQQEKESPEFITLSKNLTALFMAYSSKPFREKKKFFFKIDYCVPSFFLYNYKCSDEKQGNEWRVPMKSELKYSAITLDRKKPDLLFIQLAAELRRQINSTCLNCEAVLPSARNLAEKLNINRVTVGKAYQELMKLGLIERKSSRILQISRNLRRKNIEPYPNIGIILPCRFSDLISSHGDMPLLYLKGIIDAATEKELAAIMLELPGLSASAAEIARFNDSLMKRLIGIVHLGGRDCFPDRPLEAVMRNENLPQVMISAYPAMRNIGAVVFDTASGARALAEQLCAMRHKKVGLILYSPNFDSAGSDGYFSYAAFRRPAEVRAVFQEYGLECEEKYMCMSCNSYHATFNALRKKVNAGELPTVFWCHNDELAHWCIRALKQLGISVPDDISVVGFDGASASREEDDLTTISLPFYAIGRRAVQSLLDYYENGISDSNRLAYLQTFLVSKRTLSYAKNGNRKNKDREK